MGILGDTWDSIVAAFNGGPANWRERLAGEISLISPEGNEFTADWRGNSRSMAKKLGVLKHPKIKGDIVQDMNVSSWLYPISFFFAGENNDTEANRFGAACTERGTWDITHPVDGFHTLQLVSVTRNDNPVESGGVTEFNTEWIEPIDPLSLKTGREMKGIIDSKVDDLNVSAAQQFANSILATSEGLKDAIKNTTDGIARVSDLLLSPLFTTVDALDNAENAIQQGMTDTYQATIFQVESLAGQVQNLIELPVFSGNGLGNRMVPYADLAAAFLAMRPGESDRTVRNTASDDEKVNAIATLELGLAAVVASIGRIISTLSIVPRGAGPADTGALATRPQAIQTIIDIQALHDSIIEGIEAAADEYNDRLIDSQYYAFLLSYSDISSLLGLAIEYLLSATEQLAIERRYTLDRPRAPIEIAISEYGSLGADDANLDMFIRSNDLHGPDIMLLLAGREVVLYA